MMNKTYDIVTFSFYIILGTCLVATYQAKLEEKDNFRLSFIPNITETKIAVEGNVTIRLICNDDSKDDTIIQCPG